MQNHTHYLLSDNNPIAKARIASHLKKFCDRYIPLGAPYLFSKKDWQLYPCHLTAQAFLIFSVITIFIRETFPNWFWIKYLFGLFITVFLASLLLTIFRLGFSKDLWKDIQANDNSNQRELFKSLCVEEVATLQEVRAQIHRYHKAYFTSYWVGGITIISGICTILGVIFPLLSPDVIHRIGYGLTELIEFYQSTHLFKPAALFFVGSLLLWFYPYLARMIYKKRLEAALEILDEMIVYKKQHLKNNDDI